jgi:hypothetical protein
LAGNGRPAIPHNAWRIDWFHGSLFENREDVVEADPWLWVDLSH